MNLTNLKYWWTKTQYRKSILDSL